MLTMNRKRNIVITLTVLESLFLTLMLLKKERKHVKWRYRKDWVRPLFLERKKIGFFHTIFPELKTDNYLFFRYTRMSIEQFNCLLYRVGPFLVKRSKREPLSPEHRLIITIRYLATGDMPLSISVQHLIGVSTVYLIIKETCEAIANALAPIYLSAPTEEEWKEIKKGFWEHWNMPNCVGAIDGKHINIKAPPNSGSMFFNYKRYFSIVLLAVCDHKYKFTLVDVGSYGSESDAGIFNRCEFGRALYSETLSIPRNYFKLPDSNTSTPLSLVGDEAFAISPRIMRPFPAKDLDVSKRIFNYRLSRARRVIENTFGLLVARWQIFNTLIGVRPKNVDRIVMATICLHNFLMVENEKRTTNEQEYCPPGFLDSEDDTGNITEGHWRREDNNQLRPMRAEDTNLDDDEEEEIDSDSATENNHENVEDHFLQPISQMRSAEVTRMGHHFREKLEHYFSTPEGAVSWQSDYLSRTQHGADLTPF